MYNTDLLADRLEKADLKGGCNPYEDMAEEAKDWATEIVSAAMLEKCCCKNEDVECYFCTLTNEVIKKLEEN